VTHSAPGEHPAPGTAEREHVVTALQSALGVRHEIRVACLHGSFERGEPYRDIDLAVWVDTSAVGPQARVREVLTRPPPR
jgi:hypothetical protein